MAGSWAALAVWAVAHGAVPVGLISCREAPLGCLGWGLGAPWAAMGGVFWGGISGAPTVRPPPLHRRACACRRWRLLLALGASRAPPCCACRRGRFPAVAAFRGGVRPFLAQGARFGRQGRPFAGGISGAPAVRPPSLARWRSVLVATGGVSGRRASVLAQVFLCVPPCAVFSWRGLPSCLSGVLCGGAASSPPSPPPLYEGAGRGAALGVPVGRVRLAMANRRGGIPSFVGLRQPPPVSLTHLRTVGARCHFRNIEMAQAAR